MKMKIGYWLGNVNLTGGGVAPYGRRVLEMLLTEINNFDIDLTILCSENRKADCLSLLEKYQVKAKISLIPSRLILIYKGFIKILEVIAKSPIKSRLPSLPLAYLNKWFRWVLSLDIDLLYVPYQANPFHESVFPSVVTMHDVQELHYPEFFTPDERAWRAEYYWKSLKNSSAVAVSFNHVKQDLIKYFDLPDDKIHVCPIPHNNINLEAPNHEQELIYEQKYAQWENFILYPAQFWEHKNHISLIKAVEFIKKKFNKSVNVSFTGRKNHHFFSTIKNYLQTSEVAKRIHFLGLVPEDELHWLYKNCSLVVIPTLYEAGSFPLLEAMSLNTPVICSSVTSLPETINDARFIFEPLNIEQMADLIIRMLDDSELRSANIANSEKRTKELREINSFPYFYELWKYAIAQKQQ
jgi:glycosyltransferase involved in cell wall biosynthesis